MQLFAQLHIVANGNFAEGEAMDGLVKVFDTTDKILLGVGILLVLLVILQPSKLPLFKIEWTRAKAVAVGLIGLVLFALSFPQVRNTLILDKVAIPKADFQKLQAELNEALNQATAARTSSGNGNQCAGYGTKAENAIIHVRDIINRLQ